MVNHMQLCDKIAKLRKRNGLSQEELANKLGVSRQSVFKWECGENTPEIEKIKKLAKLFNVSFDTFLDDEKDLTVVGEAAKEEQKKIIKEIHVNKAAIKYRKPYDSGVKLSTSSLADFEHGFIGKDRIPNLSFSSNSLKQKELMEKRGFTKTIRIQNDVLVDFFVDEKNKLFGFFYDRAPQFVCPFENLASFSISNSGTQTGYTKAPMVGVGIGSNPSIGIGSMPLPQTRQPLSYDVAISYFDEKGSLKNYKIAFECNRIYILYDGVARSVDEFYLWENLLSQNTNKSLNEVSSYLSGIKEASIQIKEGRSPVKDIDLESIVAEVKAGQDRKKTIYDNYNKVVVNSQRKKKLAILITFIVVVVGVLGSIAGCSIYNAVKANQIAENNKNKAQYVVNLIDNLGQITLDSGTSILTAENAYNALTQEQKNLVTNYDTLASARAQLDTLVDQKREEETKDDPSRTIVLTDLNGRWEYRYEEWVIGNLNEGVAVLYWTSETISPGIITGPVKSSYLVGYNNKTQVMEIKLFHYTSLGGEYLDVSMTKSSTEELTLNYGSKSFYKKAAS